jgi:phosphoribosylamine--glycine ligase
MGDPETQAVLPLLNSDLLEVMVSCLEGDAASIDLTWSDDAAVDVVLAAAGYPESPRLGDAIRGVATASAMPGVTIFHAGTTRQEGTLKTSGGRVINVVGTAGTLAEARRLAYSGAEAIRFDGKQYRSDIAGLTRGT